MTLLSSFDTVTKANQGVKMPLRDLRSGQPSGAWLILLGKDSDEFRSIKSERSRMLSDRASSGASTELSQDELDQLACEMLARCTVGWGGLDAEDGPLKFSREEANKLYANYPAIREQANVFIAERSHFVLA